MISLVPPIAIKQIADVMTYGATKYGAHNWTNGIMYSRLLNALHRHLNSWENPYEPDEDSETGLSHLAHAACCLCFLLHFEAIGKNYGVNHDLDDRNTPREF